MPMKMNHFGSLFYLYSIIFILLFPFVTFFLALLIALIFIFALAYFSAPKPLQGLADTMIPYRKPMTVAHNCAGHDAPENTIIALHKAILNGAKAVEFGIQFTSDQIAVVYSGTSLESRTNGTGRISQVSYNFLAKIYYLPRDDSRNSTKTNDSDNENNHIIKLEDMIVQCLKDNIIMMIEIKSEPRKAISYLINLFTKYPRMYEHTIICSCNPFVVYRVRKLKPEIVTALKYYSLYYSVVRSLKKRSGFIATFIYGLVDRINGWLHYNVWWYVCGNSFFLANINDICETLICHFDKLGITTIAWTANKPLDRKYILQSLECSVISDTMVEYGMAPPQFDCLF